MRKKLKIPPSVHLGNVTIIGKNIFIGENTYFNGGYVSTAEGSIVRIGRWCAIGYNVTILSVTHDPLLPTGPREDRPLKTGNVVIGDGTWIGNNVVITPGVNIGRQCVIGANAVVAKDIPDFALAAGIPCRVIRTKTPEEIANHDKYIK